MSVVYLVRHAHASFLELNYDKLSKLGEAQACLLGEYWVGAKKSRLTVPVPVPAPGRKTLSRT
jgi:broad specificity phosphatase PhoE